MNNLPVELLDRILKNVVFDSSKQFSSSLRSVSKAICRIITRDVFRSLEFSCDDAGLERLREISNSKALFDVVEEIKLSFGDEDDSPFLYSEEPLILESHLPSLLSFSMLRSIIIEFAGPPPDTLETLRVYAVRQITVVNNIIKDTHLNSLAIHRLIKLPENFFETDLVVQALVPLQCLALSFVYDTEFYLAFRDGGDLEDLFRPAARPQTPMPSIQWQLKDLTIESEMELDYVTRVDMSRLHFPHLSSLSLENITFKPKSFGPPVEDGTTQVSNDAGPVEEFIIRHKASLQQLQLDRCLSSYSTYRSPEGRRDWSTVWNNFAQELTHLIDFKCQMVFAEDFESEPGTLGYGDINDDSGTYFVQDLEDDEIIEGDASALQRLHQVVEGRRNLRRN